MLSMGRFHPAVPVTGSVALTLAADAPGTVVHDLRSGGAARHRPAARHPGGHA